MRILEEFGTLIFILGIGVAMALFVLISRILFAYTNLLTTIIGMFVYVSVLGFILWLLNGRSKI